MTMVLTNSQNYTDIADAIRLKAGTSDTFKPAEMAGAIAAIPSGGGTAKWTRPEGWPNLDLISIDYANDEEVLYLTYDRSANPQTGAWAAFEAQATAAGLKITVEHGSINSSGVFTAIESWESGVASSAGGTIYCYISSMAGDDPYPLLRLTASNGHIQCLSFCQLNSGNNYNCGAYQPCVERVGNLPYINVIYNNASVQSGNERYYTFWMQRDALAPGRKANLTTLVNAFNGAYRLCEIDFSHWDTSLWHVASLSYTFANCFSLLSLDLSKWDTTNWQVTAIDRFCYNCQSLQSIDMTGWKTSSWTFGTALTQIFANCSSLKEVDFSSWNVSNNALSNFQAAFYGCGSLETVKFTWAGRTIAPSNINNMFVNCLSLKTVDMDNLSWRNVTDTGQLMTSYSKLANVSDGFGALAVNLNLSNQWCLSADSAKGIFANLGTVTSKTISLPTGLRAILTAEDIAVATAKGWTVSFT